jgi:hypothetical protein
MRRLLLILALVLSGLATPVWAVCPANTTPFLCLPYTSSETQNTTLRQIDAALRDALPSVNSSTFALLGTAPNGSIRYCTDCAAATPCAGSGVGSIAIRTNGVWICPHTATTTTTTTTSTTSTTL